MKRALQEWWFFAVTSPFKYYREQFRIWTTPTKENNHE